MNDNASHHIRCLMTTIIVKDAAKAIDFYKKNFDAEELYRFETDGRIGHSELRIGGSIVCVADEWPGTGVTAPTPGAALPSGFFLMVDDADVWVKRLSDAGAKIFMGPIDTFYGHRCGVVTDPFGHRWNISHVKEIVGDAEMRRRMREMMKSGDGCGADKE